MSGTNVRGGIYILLFALAASSVRAQSSSQSDSSSFLGRSFNVGGEIGTYGELYSIQGQERRRPSSTGRLFFRPTLTFFNTFSLNFDVLLSTEGSSARQNINQLGLNPQWGWGNAHVGDFSESYSDYTLSGILIRGAGFNINPGIFRLSAIGGYTKRAVSGGAETGAYDRYLYGGKIGIGSEAGGYVDLLFLRVRDKASSLQAINTTPVGIDTLNPALTPQRQYEVTPQENLVGGILSNLKLFDNTIQWKTEASVGLFTRDMRIAADPTINLPSAVDKLYRANITSNVDFAVVTEMAVDINNVNVRGGYKYVGPGYNSLGVGSLLNDLQEFSLAPTIRLADWNVALSYTRQNDNLVDQKLFTTVRNTYGSNITFHPLAIWTSNLLGNYLTMRNNSTNDTTRIGFSNLMLGANQIFSFPPGSWFQAITLNYIYQLSQDDSPLRSNLKTTTQSANLGGTIPLGTSMTLSPSGGVILTEIGSLRSTTTTCGLAVQHRAAENKLTNGLSGTASFLGSTKSFRTSLSSNYQWTTTLSVGLSLSVTNFRGSASQTVEFDEYTGSLTVSQRF
jgi:hypothetical protein